jgi:hypothetical protein
MQNKFDKLAKFKVQNKIETKMTKIIKSEIETLGIYLEEICFNNFLIPKTNKENKRKFLE